MNSKIPMADVRSDFDTRFRRESFEKCGEGFSGNLYKCTDSLSGRPVVVKQIKIGDDTGSLTLAGLRESRTLTMLSHPNILKMYHTYYRKGNILLVLEPCRTDAASLIREGRVFPQAYRTLLFRQALSALAFMHDSWTVNRDVKMSNILLTDDGDLRLADFGLSRVYNFCRQDTGDVGTKSYRAPELFLGGKKYQFASDIWSLAICFAELILGCDGDNVSLYDAFLHYVDSGYARVDIISDSQIIHCLTQLLGLPSSEQRKDLPDNNIVRALLPDDNIAEVIPLPCAECRTDAPLSTCPGQNNFAPQQDAENSPNYNTLTSAEQPGRAVSYVALPAQDTLNMLGDKIDAGVLSSARSPGYLSSLTPCPTGTSGTDSHINDACSGSRFQDSQTPLPADASLLARLLAKHGGTSEEVDLICKMLQWSPLARPSAHDCLEYALFQGSSEVRLVPGDLPRQPSCYSVLMASHLTTLIDEIPIEPVVDFTALPCENSVTEGALRLSSVGAFLNHSLMESSITCCQRVPFDEERQPPLHDFNTSVTLNASALMMSRATPCQRSVMTSIMADTSPNEQSNGATSFLMEEPPLAKMTATMISSGMILMKSPLTLSERAGANPLASDTLGSLCRPTTAAAFSDRFPIINTRLAQSTVNNPYPMLVPLGNGAKATTWGGQEQASLDVVPSCKAPFCRPLERGASYGCPDNGDYQLFESEITLKSDDIAHCAESHSPLDAGQKGSPPTEGEFASLTYATGTGATCEDHLSSNVASSPHAGNTFQTACDSECVSPTALLANNTRNFTVASLVAPVAEENEGSVQHSLRRQLEDVAVTPRILNLTK